MLHNFWDLFPDQGLNLDHGSESSDPYAIRELPSVALDLDCKEYEHSVPNSGNVPKTTNSWKNIHKTIAK